MLHVFLPQFTRLLAHPDPLSWLLTSSYVKEQNALANTHKHVTISFSRSETCFIQLSQSLYPIPSRMHANAGIDLFPSYSILVHCAFPRRDRLLDHQRQSRPPVQDHLLDHFPTHPGIARIMRKASTTAIRLAAPVSSGKPATFFRPRFARVLSPSSYLSACSFTRVSPLLVPVLS